MISRTEGFITVADGERVWYETAGEGPDLILTHGLGGNAAVWYQQVPYFAQHYRVISWDQRGFGATEFDGKSLARAVYGQLPAYALPLFVLVVESLEHTTTFKSRKVELREHAYGPDVKDPLYVLAGRDDG